MIPVSRLALVQRQVIQSRRWTVSHRKTPIEPAVEYADRALRLPPAIAAFSGRACAACVPGYVVLLPGCRHGTSRRSDPTAFPRFRNCTRNSGGGADGRSRPLRSASCHRAQFRRTPNGRRQDSGLPCRSGTAHAPGATVRGSESTRRRSTAHARPGASRYPSRGRY